MARKIAATAISRWPTSRADYEITVRFFRDRAHHSPENPASPIQAVILKPQSVGESVNTQSRIDAIHFAITSR
jgi:hypothetical protein